MNKKDIINSSQKLFKKRFNSKPTIISTAPGRINLIGEHLDYNNGVAIPCAIDRWTCVCISKSKDNTIIVRSETLESEIILNTDLKFKPEQLWHKYILGSLCILQDTKKLDSGLNILINSNIPIASGLSSSAALEVSLLLSYFKLFNIEISQKELAILSQKIDHDYLLVNSGLLDQFASIYSKENQFTFIDFKDKSHNYIKNNIKDASFLVVNSMIKRELAHSKYIERVQECKKGYAILGITQIDQINSSDLNKLNDYPIIQKRFLHIISEYKRSYQMINCIVNNNIIDMGKILKESHLSLKNDYQVSCDEIDFLIDSSFEFNGWYGGRIMGGGFGGCTINLVDNNLIDQYIDLINRNYKIEFNLELDFYKLKIVEGAMIES